MVYFFIRVVVNTLAAAVVMNVAPGLRLAPFPFLGEPFATSLSYMKVLPSPHRRVRLRVGGAAHYRDVVIHPVAIHPQTTRHVTPRRHF